MNNFQTILVAVFISFFVFAVLIFSGAIKLPGGNSSSGIGGKVVVWGTISSSGFSETIASITTENRELSLNYIQKNKDTYQQDLIEAFANGKAPDLFIITPDMINRNSNFIYKIPYTVFPEKIFKDTFIDGANVYMNKDGILGLPLLVDPIVLYYNKDLLVNEGITNPIKTWDELFSFNSTLTKRDNGGVISQSMIALGQYNNINNVKDILVTLLIQNNVPIVSPTDNGFAPALKDNPLRLAVSPVEAVLKFFVEFSNPSNSAYSWNRSLPDSIDMFTLGKSAFYIGRASELFEIQSVNPNLSFDVTQIPQIKDSTTKRTMGEIYAISINSKSSNLNAAISVARLISEGDNAKSLSTATSLPPVLRSLISQKPADNPYLFTFFNSALIARSWPDPDKIKSDLIFKELVENILSNTLSVGESINKAQGQLEQLINKK